MTDNKAETSNSPPKRFQFSLTALFVLGLMSGLLGATIVGAKNQAELKADIRSLERKNKRLLEQLRAQDQELTLLKQTKQN